MTTVILVRHPAPRDLHFDLYTDITGALLVDVAWLPPDLQLTFDGDLTTAQVNLVRLRTQALDASEETLLKAAVNALQNNSNYLGIAAPDNAAVRTQVDRLTRQVSNLIRTRLDLGGVD